MTTWIGFGCSFSFSLKLRIWRAYGLSGKLSTLNLTKIAQQNGHLIKFPWQISFENVLQFNLESKTEFFNNYLQTQMTGCVGALQKFRFPFIIVVFAFTNTTSHEIFNVSIGCHFEVDCLILLFFSSISSTFEKRVNRKTLKVNARSPSAMCATSFRKI